MTFTLLPPLGQNSPRPAFWLCMVVLLIWSTSVVSAQAEYRRVYKMKNIKENRLKGMADGMKRCADWVGGELAIADTVEKENEIEYAVDLYHAKSKIRYDVSVMLGGSVSGRTCTEKMENTPGNCLWCWDYGAGNCGENNESYIGTGGRYTFVPADGGYHNWMSSEPYRARSYPYIYYLAKYRRWRATDTSETEYADDLLCVVKEPITNSTESSSSSLYVSLEEPTAAPSGFTKWWVILVIIVGLLILAAVVITIVCCCCCGAGAPVEEEYKPEDDDRLSSVRDTRSNRSLVRGGGSMRRGGSSMRSMGSRRSSAYSTNQSYSQGDMDDYNSNGDDCVYQGRSGASYYY